MGEKFCSKDSLLKWNLLPHESKRRHAHDVDQWQIPEKVLSMIKLTPYLWSDKYSGYSIGLGLEIQDV